MVGRSKKRRKDRKRGTSRAASTAQARTREAARDLYEQVRRGPSHPGAGNVGRAEEYAAAFSHFEEWILLGRPEGFLDVRAVPPEHNMMIDFWPEAFEAYRHALWAYLERHTALHLWSSTVRSLLIRARRSDPVGYDEFIRVLDDAMPRFVEQKRNSVQRHMQAERDPDRARALRASLSAYADTYEIDLPMWFLAVLGRALTTGKLTPEAFGGPSSSTSQAALINSAVEALRGTPLERLLRDAYDAKLRNAIQHNDYELRIGTTEVTVSMLDGSRTWHGDELYNRVTGTQQLVEAVQTVSAYVRLVEEPLLKAEFSQAGLVAVLFSGYQDNLPHAAVHQLWCFHEMDTAGTWLDGCTVTFEVLEDGREKVSFTERGYTIGEPVSHSEQLGDELRRHGWMHVTRIPVAPNFDLGYPVVDLPAAAASYEVVGVPDEHVVKVRL